MTDTLSQVVAKLKEEISLPYEEYVSKPPSVTRSSRPALSGTFKENFIHLWGLTTQTTLSEQLKLRFYGEYIRGPNSAEVVLAHNERRTSWISARFHTLSSSSDMSKFTIEKVWGQSNSIGKISLVFHLAGDEIPKLSLIIFKNINPVRDNVWVATNYGETDKFGVPLDLELESGAITFKDNRFDVTKFIDNILYLSPIDSEPDVGIMG